MKACAGGQTMTWDQFFNLILDHAQNIDSTSTPKKTQKAHTATQSRSQPGRGHARPPRNPPINHQDYIPPEKWALMSREEKKKILAKRKSKRGVNQAQVQVNNASTTPAANTPVAATPTTAPTVSETPPNPVQRFLNQANTQQPRTITVDGVVYTANVTHITYHAHRSQVNNYSIGSLIDRGANGGLSGDDVVVLASSTSQFADVRGIAGAEVTKIPLSTVAGVLQTTTGPVLGIFHQYAHYGQGHTLHSPLQLEAFGLDVRDTNVINRPKQQHIQTPDGYVIPLNVHHGLIYMPMTKPTDLELHTLTQVFMTADQPWDPYVYDNIGHTYLPPREIEEKTDDDTWELTNSYEANEMACLIACKSEVHVSLPRNILPKIPNFEKLRPVFAWIPTARIKDTLKHTTQWYKAEGRLPMRRHFKSRFPGANVARREETVATDTIFSDTPAMDDCIAGHGGCTMMQFFCGTTSEFTAAYPMSSEQQVHSALQDFIRYYGAPRNLFSDNAKAQISKQVQDILRHFNIAHYRSEPHQQNQNPAERRIQDIKKHTNMLLDRTGSPAATWLLCMLYVIDLHNHLASSNHKHQITPIQKAFGYVPDISKFLQFHWWQRVLYRTDNVSFPSTTYEGIGRFVGIANNIGDLLTYHVLTDDTQQVIARSMVRALDPMNPNVRVLHPEHTGEDMEPIPIVKSIVHNIHPAYDPTKVK